MCDSKDCDVGVSVDVDGDDALDVAVSRVSVDERPLSQLPGAKEVGTNATIEAGLCLSNVL